MDRFPPALRQTAAHLQIPLIERGSDAAGKAVLGYCASWIREGELPPEGPVRDYLVEVLERIADGKSLPKALGKKNRSALQDFVRNVEIFEAVDTLWLFGMKKDDAIEAVRKSHAPHLTRERVRKIVKSMNLGSDDALSEHHYGKILAEIRRRIDNNGEPPEVAYREVKAMVNPRAPHRGWLAVADDIRYDYGITFPM